MIRLSSLFWLFPFICFFAGYFTLSFFYKNKIISAPDLVGKTIASSATILVNQKLNLRIIDYKEDIQLPEGTILQQVPASGKSIKETQTLYITLSKKPSRGTIPSFISLSSEQIRDLLETADLRIKTYSLSYDWPLGTCFAQLPAAGTQTNDNNLIIYMASALHKAVIMPNFKERKLEEIQSLLDIHSIIPTILHQSPMSVGHKCTHCIITDQRPNPGALIYLNEPNKVSIQLQVTPSTR